MSSDIGLRLGLVTGVTDAQITQATRVVLARCDLPVTDPRHRTSGETRDLLEMLGLVDWVAPRRPRRG